MPLGWWIYTTKWPPARGDYVAMRDAPFWPHRILLKRVEGVAGDTFCWRDGRHWINDRPMPKLSPLAFDMEAQTATEASRSGAVATRSRRAQSQALVRAL